MSNRQKQGVIARLLSLPNDNPTKTIMVALILCLVCSVLVSTSAVVLKSRQIANQQADIKKNILAVTGLLIEGGDIDALFDQFDIKMVDLNTGDYVDIDPTNYNQYKMAKDPSVSTELAAEVDIANIGRRADVAPVYLLKQGDTLDQVVLPLHGYGLWSTLYGFISFEADFNTIGGLQFYAHAETPGLGGEVDNPKWRAQWHGKKAFDENGELKIKVIRGHVNYQLADAKYQIDGLSGATLTSQGVSKLVNFWLGDHGFGPYLQKMSSEMEK